MPKNDIILIAEDEKIISDTLISQITENGIQAELAKDGKEAWEKIQQVNPCLIILDLIIPKLNGFEVLQNIRESKKFKNTPVIILSNLGQESDIEECKRLGANEYFVKSNISIDAVVDVVKKYHAQSVK